MRHAITGSVVLAAVFGAGPVCAQTAPAAQAEVSVRLSENGKSVTAKGADVDTLVASANAYLGALNKLMIKRQRGKPEAMVMS